jgi:hypothetical protein
MPSKVASAHLHHRTRHRNAFDAEQVFERKVQAHAKHQQHHADFGQLGGHVHMSATKPGVPGPKTMPASR